MVKAESSLGKRLSYVVVSVLKKPLVEITLDYPSSIEFGQVGAILFGVAPKTGSYPSDVEISLIHDPINENWVFDKLDARQVFEIRFRGSHLKIGNNTFKVLVKYSDDQGNDYLAEKDFMIKLENVTFFQRIIIGLNALSKRIENWLSI
jgi:hypothetical protein